MALMTEADFDLVLHFLAGGGLLHFPRRSLLRLCARTQTQAFPWELKPDSVRALKSSCLKVNDSEQWGENVSASTLKQKAVTPSLTCMDG